jgi:hypothetical protein
MKNLNSKIETAEILESLSKITGTEIWNATYQSALDILSEQGYHVYAEPFETMATLNRVAWYAAWPRITNKPDGTCIIEHNCSATSFMTWVEAIDSALKYACRDCIANLSESPGKTVEPELEADKIPVDAIDRKSTENSKKPEKQDRTRSMDHPYYARHSEDDPYPYE